MRPKWFRLVIPDLHVAGCLAKYWAAAMLYALGAAVLVDWLDIPRWQPGFQWAALNGVVLGLLLVFRNKEAYDRWWEGRKLWGQLINETRNLAIKAQAFADVSPNEQAVFRGRLLAFAHALRQQLRSPGTVHEPLAAAQAATEQIASWLRGGCLPTAECVLLLDGHARALLDICGACERIRNTPLPSSYRALLRHGIWLYVLAAPWLMALEVSYWCLPVLGAVYYFVLGIEFTAEDVEEPFGNQLDDLALDDYCRTIETSLDAIGRGDVVEACHQKTLRNVGGV